MDQQPPNDQGPPPPEQPTEPPITPEPSPEVQTTPSWEHTDEYGFFGALVKTIGEVLFHPENTFRNLKIGGSIGAPFLFGWLLQSICQLISLYQVRNMIFNQLQWYLPHRMKWDLPPNIEIFPSFDFFPAMFVLVPVAVAISLFIKTGILHICLMIAGGAKKDIDVTFRVTAYSEGATAPWLIVPFVGSLVAWVWQLVCIIIGLKEAHQTTTGRVILAILLPLIICCGLGIMVTSMFLGGSLL